MPTMWNAGKNIAANTSSQQKLTGILSCHVSWPKYNEWNGDIHDMPTMSGISNADSVAMATTSHLLTFSHAFQCGRMQFTIEPAQ